MLKIDANEVFPDQDELERRSYQLAVPSWSSHFVQADRIRIFMQWFKYKNVTLKLPLWLLKVLNIFDSPNFLIENKFFLKKRLP